ncbi:hypertrehalosaemic prohormone-like [Coccinella septempunctata]|uniref:hypertrehalosaemic prohormone-like n=1 Tax=Coccinella septempunctata TaxID=41139 RepID=UPI001D077724|nr:hypertrehalosaemic prohormone-like [Coccinella septempunctata]
MHRLVFILVVFGIFGLCIAQLNFTPNWGKRSSSTTTDVDSCRTSMIDSMMVIYKMIENQAQKLIECEKGGN